MVDRQEVHLQRKTCHPWRQQRRVAGRGVHDAEARPFREDSNISSSILWSSDIDGPLGSGALISSTLSIESHTITAQVTDSDSNTVTHSIQITITEAPQINTEGQVTGFVTIIPTTGTSFEVNLTDGIGLSDGLTLIHTPENPPLNNEGQVTGFVTIIPSGTQLQGQIIGQVTIIS